MPNRFLLSVLPFVLLPAGCGWVDSTGSSSSSSSSDAPVLLDDATNEVVRGFDENKSSRFLANTFGADLDATFLWEDLPPADAPLGICEMEPDYRHELAVTALSEACTDPEDCAIVFERLDDAETGKVAYELTVPKLKAPVGLQRRLTITSRTIGVVETTYDFCLIAVNEGPVPGNDGPYEIVEGTTLIIGDDEPDLLTNDTDDIDVGNAELVLLESPNLAPSLASDFQIFPEGGFRYSYPEVGLEEPLEDHFEYTVFDGVHESVGRVDIRILPGNRPPVQEGEIPALTVNVNALVGAEFAEYFSDPEASELSFRADEATLPPSRSLTFTSDGVLRGFPVEEDIGEYRVTLVVSDGDRELFSSFDLAIEPALNARPVFVEDSVGDVIVRRGRTMRPVEPVFVDPDGDTLTYQLFGFVPSGVSIDSETGVVSGRPSVRGNFRGLIVRAIDPDGESADSQRFAIRVF